LTHELAEHLRLTYGIGTSCPADQHFCRQDGIRLYRPTDRSLRGDPAKRQKAREDVAEFKRGRKG
jgi:hypothetical protein